jgi:hypothetical protein
LAIIAHLAAAALPVRMLSSRIGHKVGL